MIDGDLPSPNAQFAAWMKAVADHGDRTAFANLFQQFALRLKAYMLRLGATNAMAEELAQETMMIMWRRAKSYNPEAAAVSTWLFTIARNKRIDGVRKQKRPEIDLNDPTFTTDPERPDQILNRVQEAEQVREAIKTLSDEQAETIRMSFYEGLTQAEIADRTGLPLGTVKSRMRLALRRLRKNWVGEEEPPE